MSSYDEPIAALEAAMDAKKAGKIRYIGFTGHKDPEIHLKMLATAKAHNFLFDTVAFDRRALQFLIELAGANQVLFGTDIPFDMADLSAREIERWGDPRVAGMVLGENAVEVYGIEPAAGATPA